MGHYDSAYEYEAEQAHKEKIRKHKKLGKQVEELRLELKHSGAKVPTRFIESLEDLENWLAVQI